MIQTIALNVQKINISEKGTLLSTNTTERLKDQELKEKRGIKKWTRRRLIPSGDLYQYKLLKEIRTAVFELEKLLISASGRRNVQASEDDKRLKFNFDKKEE
jgi:hypothetical protein